jgi:hypothetical protein
MSETTSKKYTESELLDKMIEQSEVYRAALKAWLDEKDSIEKRIKKQTHYTEGVKLDNLIYNIKQLRK